MYLFNFIGLGALDGRADTLQYVSQQFETEDELDFSFGIQNLARFRGNCFKQRGCVAMVIRMIPFNVRTFQELGLPPVIAQARHLSAGGLSTASGPASPS